MSSELVTADDILSPGEVWDVPVNVTSEEVDEVDCQNTLPSINITATEKSTVHVQETPTPPRIQSPSPEEQPPPPSSPKPAVAGIDQDHFEDIVDTVEDPELVKKSASCCARFCYLCCTLACILYDKVKKHKI